MRPHRWQPTRLLCPWDSPGKNAGVGCRFLLQCMKVKVKSLSRVQLLLTPWTAAYKAPPSMRFSRQEYWSGVPLPSPFLDLELVNCGSWDFLVFVNCVSQFLITDFFGYRSICFCISPSWWFFSLANTSTDLIGLRWLFHPREGIPSLVGHMSLE